MAANARLQADEGIARLPTPTDGDRNRAATSIQKTFRGHRTRRALKGHSLDPETRWTEAVKDAQYRLITTPQGPPEIVAERPSITTKGSVTRDPDTDRATPARAVSQSTDDPQSHVPEKPLISPARKQWKRIGQIALRAGADDSSPFVSDDSYDESSPSENEPTAVSLVGRRVSTMTTEERMARRESRAKARTERKKSAKMMDLQYFLEMVDLKHRYGSNLRKYHNHWKSEPTTQNFFYWLDYGEGKDLDLPICSRERLNKEHVRYLSREERLHYLVKIDEEGRLIWAKNGERINTRDEDYRDSIHGIVPMSSKEPRFKNNNEHGEVILDGSVSEESSDEQGDEEGDEAQRYVNEDFSKAKGPRKLAHVSPAVIFDHLLRASIRKGNKWIFVADTAFRLYVGVKQSGSFQHSSFLHGSRISAAGLIKIKDGQLRSLSPLSGHYRPPAANFRSFVHSLRDEGVDMSRVSISKSYAVLVGIESYTKARRKMKHAEEKTKKEKEKVLHPEEAAKKEQAALDKSESAEKERQWLERERQRREEERRKSREDHGIGKLWRKMGSHSRGGSLDVQHLSIEETKTAHEELPDVKDVPGTGPEEGVPAPEGVR